MEARLQPSLSAPTAARRRNLRTVTVVAVAVIAALLVWRACTAGPSATAEYVDRVRPLVQESNKVGADLRGIATELPTFTREVLDERLDSLERTSSDLVGRALENKARADARDLEALLISALELRAWGIKNFRRGVANALEGVPAEQVEAELQNAFQIVAAGDRSYQLFAERARQRLVESQETKVEVPESQFMRDSPYGGDRLSQFVRTLRSQPRLAPIHNIAVAQITTRPSATSKLSGDVDLLPASSSFAVVVTVSNDGNLPERDVVVKVRMTSEVRPEPQERQQVIPSLEPGGKKTLTFTDLEPSRNQTKNTVTVFVDPVTDEKRTDDNRKDYSFAMRG